MFSSCRCLTAGFWRERSSPALRTTCSLCTSATQTTAPPQQQEPQAALLRTSPWSSSIFTALTVASHSLSESYTTLSVSDCFTSLKSIKDQQVWKQNKLNLWLKIHQRERHFKQEIKDQALPSKSDLCLCFKMRARLVVLCLCACMCSLPGCLRLVEH